MTLARQWKGQDPFQETWFIEVLFSADRGLWVRYVLDATRNQAEVWALVVERTGVVCSAHEVVPITEVGGSLFEHSQAGIHRSGAHGRCGAITWDLALEDLGIRHGHVPRILPALGLGRTYHPGILDLRVKGTLSFEGQTWEVTRGMGVLGHLWGGTSNVNRWAWAHCNAFYEDGVVFEGLSARLGPATLTSLVLHVKGHTYRFSRVRDLLRTKSRTQTNRWVFEAHSGRVSLNGELTLNVERAATVRYDGASPIFCTNSRFADIRVVLQDPERGRDLDLRSREAAFEIAGPEALAPVVLPHPSR